MAELKRSFMYDVVFKILFITRQDLLKHLVAALLDIPHFELLRIMSASTQEKKQEEQL